MPHRRATAGPGGGGEREDPGHRPPHRLSPRGARASSWASPSPTRPPKRWPGALQTSSSLLESSHRSLPPSIPYLGQYPGVGTRREDRSAPLWFLASGGVPRPRALHYQARDQPVWRRTPGCAGPAPGSRGSGNANGVRRSARTAGSGERARRLARRGGIQEILLGGREAGAEGQVHAEALESEFHAGEASEQVQLVQTPQVPDPKDLAF